MISIGIVLFQNEEFIEHFYDSLLKNIISDTQIIFIDNNSSDNSARIVRKLIGNSKGKLNDHKISYTFIQNNKNYGFSYAVHQFVERSTSETLLLINPDSIVCKYSIQKLHECLKKHTKSIVGGQFVDYKDVQIKKNSTVLNSSYSSCLLELTNVGKLIPQSLYKNTFWDNKEGEGDHAVSGITGGYMMFTKNIWNTLGGFDKHFFVYLEDLDFCMRAANSEFGLYVCPQAKLQHFGGGSSKNEYKYNRKHWLVSRKYFFKKNFSSLQYSLFKAIDLIERVFIF